MPTTMPDWQSDGLDQNVLLLAQRKLDHAVAGELCTANRHALIRDACIVDPDRTALKMTTGFAVGGGKAGLDDQRQQTDAGFELGRGNLDGRQIGRKRTLFERLARRLGSFFGCRTAVQDRRDLSGEDLLRFVDFRAAERRRRLISSIGIVV